MPITIKRNESGNCINFVGTTSPAYWNACLSGEVDAEDNTRVNIINDIRSQGGPTVYEFYKIAYTDFRDADGNPFASAQDAADYITNQANVLESTSAEYRGTWDADTNTPTLSDGDSPTNGSFYYVSVAGDTTLGGVSTWRRGDKVIWNGSVWQKLGATTIVDANTRSTLLNTQTAIFADGEAATRDPQGAPGWYYRNTENNKINWYFYGDTDVTSYTLGDFGGAYAVVDIRTAGSFFYWTIYSKPEFDGSDYAFWYRSRVNYVDESTMQAASAGRYLVHTSNMDVTGIEPTLPRISLPSGANTVGPQGSAEEIYLMALSTSSNYPEGTNEFVVEKVAFKLGDHIQAYDLAAPPTTGPSVVDDTPTTLDFRVDATNTTILTDDGKQYGVNSIQAVGNGDGTIDIVALPSGQVIYDDLVFGNLTIQNGATYNTENGAVNALNALFQVQPLGGGGDYDPTYPLLDTEAITQNTAGGTAPTTTLSDGTTVHQLTSAGNAASDSVIWSTETIDTAGEFYTVRIAGQGRFILGLGSVDAGHLDTVDDGGNSGHTGLYWGNAFYNYSGNIRPWTYYGSSSTGSYGPGWTGTSDQKMQYNTAVQTQLDSDVNLKDGALFKVGIDAQGYIAVWYYDEGRSNDWIMTARRSYTTPAGDYFLVVKLWDGNVTLTQVPEREAVDPSAPVLDYRYIESPDGSFTFPLFATAEEANYVDTQNGGSGTSSEIVFVDDPTLATWYLPDTGSTSLGSSAPVNTDALIYDEIPTLDDNQFAPSAFDIQDVTVDEGAAVNIQVAPQGTTSYSTTVTGLPSGLTFDGGTLIQGTAPQVTGDNVANPSDVYTVTVTRTNSYGSTVDTINITVTNLTAPVVDTGNWSGADISAGVLQSDGTATLGVTLSEGERLIVPKAWVDDHINPNSLTSTGQVYLGVLTSGADVTEVDQSDFDGLIKWFASAVSNYHGAGLTDNLGTTQDSTWTNAGASIYDFGIEYSDGQLHLIACNVNSLNTEPSIGDGGSFSRTMTVGTLSAPITITLGANDAATVDLTDADDLQKVTIPAAPSNQTNWDKALDFSGSSERAQQVNSSTLYTPLKMGGTNNQVAAPTAGQTVASGHPWATSCVFKIDGNSSNQHIWNLGEGSGSTDDNIYLRLDASRNLYFGWGRSGDLNELFMGSQLSTSQWYGAYIASNGARFGAGCTAAQLASAFDIRLYSSGTNWQEASATNSSTEAMWLQSNSTTGGRMNREYNGDLTIGGRGSNRNFHGKVASFVSTTLRCGQAMPGTTEITKMVTDPVGWVTDYKIGNPYRRPSVTTDSNNFALNSYDSAAGTQVWLMGDGSLDSYSNMIRSYIYPAEQNRYKLNMISMVSNDIQNVTISGLS